MKSLFLLPLLLTSTIAFSQKGLKTISLKETTRIETALAADNMEGRRAFTPGNEKAAAFIADEFQRIGLKKWNEQESYLQTFQMLKKINANKRTSYSFDLSQEGEKVLLSNVVGILPGKSKPNEYVIFSGHFDHLGISSRKWIWCYLLFKTI